MRVRGEHFASSASIEAMFESYRQPLFGLLAVTFVAALVALVRLSARADMLFVDYLFQAALVALIAITVVVLAAGQQRPLMSAMRMLVYGLGALHVAKLVATWRSGMELQQLEASLLPYAGWYPLVIILTYLCMPDRMAVWVAAAYVLALNIGLLGVILLNPVFHDSVPLAGLWVEFILALPVAIGLMHGLGHFLRRLIAQMAKVQEEKNRWVEALSVDRETGVLNRTGFTQRILDRLLDETQVKPELLVLKVENAGQLESTGGRELVRARATGLADQLRRQLGEQDLLSRMANLSFCWVRPADDRDLGELLGELLGDLPGADYSLRIGAARYHPGETLDAWIARAEFSAFAASGPAPLRYARDL